MDIMKIIIVDDEADLIELCTDIFEMEGHQAVGFTSPLKALEYIRAGNDFDAIVSDSTMPELTGLEFLEKVKELTVGNERPFFLSTGRIDFKESELLKVGVTKVIIKPFDISQVVVEIVDLIKKNKV